MSLRSDDGVRSLHMEPPEWHERRGKRATSTKSRLRGPVAHQFWLELRDAHRVFDGESIEVVVVANDGVSAAVPSSPVAQYLHGRSASQHPKRARPSTSQVCSPTTRTSCPRASAMSAMSRSWRSKLGSRALIDQDANPAGGS